MPRHTQAQLLSLLSELESFNEFTRDPQVTALFVDGKKIKHIESLIIIKDANQSLQIYALAKNFKSQELRGNDESIRGGEGKVYIAQNTATGEWVALKECYSCHAINAYSIAKKLLKTTDTIINVLATGVAQTGYYYVVMDRAKMTLEGLAPDSLTPLERQSLLAETLAFTETLAANQVGYLDVKPRNFMVSYNHQLKVCDLESLVSIQDDTPNFTYVLNVFAWLYHHSHEVIMQLRAALSSIKYRRESPQTWYEEVLQLLISKGRELEIRSKKSLVSKSNEKAINADSYSEMHLFIFRLDQLSAELKNTLTLAELRSLFFEIINLLAEPISNNILLQAEINRVKQTLLSFFQTENEAYTSRLIEIIASKDAKWLSAIIQLGLDCSGYNPQQKTMLDLVLAEKDESFALSILSVIPKANIAGASNNGATLQSAIEQNFIDFANQLLSLYQAMGAQLHNGFYLKMGLYSTIRFAIASEKVVLLPILLKTYAPDLPVLDNFMIEAIKNKKYKVVEYFAARGDINVEENHFSLAKETHKHSMLSLAVTMNDPKLVEILLTARRASMLNQESISPLAIAIQSRAELPIIFQLVMVSTARDLRKIFSLSGNEFKQWTKINKPLFMNGILTKLDEQATVDDKREWLKKILTPGTAIYMIIATHDSSIPFNFSSSGISAKTHSILQLEGLLQKLDLAPKH